MANFFDKPITYLKGVGPQRAEWLEKELNLFSYGDLLQHYPFRYEDRSRFHKVAEINESLDFIQVKGRLGPLQEIGQGRGQRMVSWLKDETGILELVWFKGLRFVKSKLKPGMEYVASGRPNRFGMQVNLPHPEMEPYSPLTESKSKYLHPVYSLTEKLKAKYINNKSLMQWQQNLLKEAYPYISETLPAPLLEQYKLMPKARALRHIHFPSDWKRLENARYRLKFEELFYIQLRLFQLKLNRSRDFKGKVFSSTQTLNAFYKKHLPFELTEAQKKVIREIFEDLKSGKQMSRLLQGDVGSGKTIVAFLTLLIVIEAGAQVALMAPTEILSKQHYDGLKEYADVLGISIACLTGSSKTAERRVIHHQLEEGTLSILVGTHALLEEKVKFKELGLAIIDEQHRFGVAQRARMWQKNKNYVPHMLVMTATPIPRTLAMTLYGDLEVSVIDELPAGRKPIETWHFYEKDRLKVFGFIRQQLNLGRQAYIVYPLIEESEKLSFKDLMDGYESISRAFPDVPLSIVHGKQKAADKEWEMARFKKGETKIMVATTVIEVGVNVPNASLMVIESAEKFGLAQLHQLRGRVGRGSEQSFCFLMTDVKLSKEARERMKTMVATNNGFEIAEKDLKLRGPGDLMGTQQSGMMELLIADLAKDGQVLAMARNAAKDLFNRDPDLKLPENSNIREQIGRLKKNSINWSRIS